MELGYKLTVCLNTQNALFFYTFCHAMDLMDSDSCRLQLLSTNAQQKERQFSAAFFSDYDECIVCKSGKYLIFFSFFFLCNLLYACSKREEKRKSCRKIIYDQISRAHKMCFEMIFVRFFFALLESRKKIQIKRQFDSAVLTSKLSNSTFVITSFVLWIVSYFVSSDRRFRRRMHEKLAFFFRFFFVCDSK